MDRHWLKSSRCDNGSCVEVGEFDGDVHVRDTWADELAFSAEAWAQFVEGVKDGEFDRPS